MYYLFGLIRAEKNIDYGSISFIEMANKPTNVSSQVYRDVALVYSQLENWKFDTTDKSQLLEKLLSHQKTLEKIMQHQLVIPIKFGTVVGNLEDVQAILKKDYMMFDQTLKEMDDKIEVSLTVSWDTKKQLQKIAEKDQQIKDLKQKMKSTGGSADLMAQIGKLLDEKLKQRRDEMASQILQSFNHFGNNCVEYDIVEDQMILNSSFLLRKDDEKLFEELIYQLDDQFAGEFNFKLLSPLPPHSFCTAVIEKIPSETLDEMLQLFEVDTTMTLSKLQEKNRELIKQYHPDIQAQTKDADFSKIHQTFDILKTFYQSDEKPFLELDKARCYLTQIVTGGVS